MKSVAQIFSPNGAYVPTKVAAFLQPAGTAKPCFVFDTNDVVIDATNWSSISNSGGLGMFGKAQAGYTGAGHLTCADETLLAIGNHYNQSGFTGGAADGDLNEDGTVDFDDLLLYASTITTTKVKASYPLKVTQDGKFNLWFRYYADYGFSVQIYVDGKLAAEDSFNTTGSWVWGSLSLTMPDTQQHVISIETVAKRTRFDKFVITRSTTPTGLGPDYTEAPYVTVHARLASASSGVPTTFYPQEHSITTLDLTKNGWQNFDLRIRSVNNVTLNNTLAFVIDATGSRPDHYVIWAEADKVQNPIAVDSGSSYVADATHSMSFRAYADQPSLDADNCIINTPNASLENTTVNDFSIEKLLSVHDNTVLVDDNVGGNDVELDVREKVFTIVIDQSGSNSWNDSTGLRHQFAIGVVDALESRYPSEIRFNLLKFNAEPAFSFFVPLSEKIESNKVSDIIRASFKGKPDNFAGFRVVRNPDRYPLTAIDGEIVQSGFALGALDIDLEHNKQYFYTVYTYDQFDRFSYGVRIPAKTNVIDVPRGIPTFSLGVQLGYDVVRDEHIIGMWNTDEGNGSYLYDFSDKNNTLTLSKTRWISEYDCPTGRYGVRFNGVTSVATGLPTTTFDTQFNEEFSVDGWIQPFSNGSMQCLIQNGNDTTRNWVVFLNELKLGLSMSDGSSVQSSVGLEVEEWSHFAVTFSNGAVKFYINGSLVTTASLSSHAQNVGNNYITIGNDPSTGFGHFFGKLSHIHVHDVARDGSYIAGAATPKQRFTQLGDPPGRIPPDNGDRLVVANFEIPEDFNYDLIRVVRNHVRMPYYETDGDVVLEITPTAGIHSYGLPYDYDLDSDYWFRIFTRNSLGNWSPIEDSVGQLVHIPDQDRPHIVISCGPNCVTEISPGPGFGSCGSPNIEIGRGGNEKVHIRWTVPTNVDCSLVKIYYTNNKFVTYDNRTKWIVNSDSFEGDTATPIFVGPSLLGEWVHRNVPNKQSGFYTIVFTDRLGKHSSLVNLQITPLATADDSGIPLQEALDVAYRIDDYDRIRITWRSPFVISSSNEGWFDDKFYFYGAICDMYGKPLPIDFPDDVKVTTNIGESIQSSVEDVFDRANNTDTPDRIPVANFAINSGGLITGVLRLRSSPLFAVLKSLAISVSAEYSYSPTFKWTFPSSVVKFKTPLDMRLVNRDSQYLSTGDFVQPPCPNDYESGGSDQEKSPYRLRVNGAFIRRQAPFVARAIFTYKGLPLRQAAISARLYDALGGPCGFSVPSLNAVSRTLKFAESSFPIRLAVLPVLDVNGNPTGTEEMTSYADIPMAVPYLPQAARLYVRVRSQAFQSVARMNMFYPSTLRMSLSATAPKGDGADVKEQFARAWFIDPDYPNDQSRIQVVPDLSVIKWVLTKDGSTVRKVPFYSTDTVPLINGVYSYARSGTARFVFFGPAKSGSEGTYKLVASTTVSGLSGSVEANLEIKIPGGNGFENYIPDPTAPRIFCEMDECINYLWADGEDYVKMRIFRNPADPNKTLVPDEVNGGYRQAKYATKFRECSVDDDGNSVLFPLPVGTVVTVNAPGYEIIWGSVSEIVNEEAGTKKLNTQGAFNALNTADITLGRDAYYTVYFRKDAQIQSAGCRDVSATNCCGFDMAERICSDPYEIGGDQGVIVSTKINLAGKPVVIFGGGPIGDDNVARPPCVLVPREPLFFKLVGIFVNNQIVEEVVVDGQTMNKFIFEIKYNGRAVPQGVPIDVLLVANINGEDVTQIGDFDIHTYFGVPKTIYSYTSTAYPGIDRPGVYSFASFTINPIPTDKNIAIGVGVSTTYSGKIISQSSSSSSSGAA